MARIRSIKPEFWSSPDLPEDPWVRLLYIAMWNWADDMGVGTAIPRELLGFAFPNDEHLTVVDLRRMLVEIRRVFGVKFYEVAGRPYYAIPSWEEHQKFDRRSKGKHPGPDEEESQVKWMKSEDSTESHESPSSTRRDSVAGTGEQGNRGTDTSSNEALDSAKKKNPYPKDFEEWYNAYPRHEGKGDALKAWQQLKKDKILPDLNVLVEAARAYERSETRTQFRKLPGGWLRAHKWEDEVTPAVAAREPVRPPEGQRWAADVINDPEFQENWESWKPGAR